MELESAVLDGALVITVRGRLDVHGAPVFEKRCAPLIRAGQGGVVVDCHGVEYISSAGLRAVISLGKQAKAVGVPLAFCRMGEMVREVFAISGVLGLFPVSASPEEAVAGFRHG